MFSKYFSSLSAGKKTAWCAVFLALSTIANIDGVFAVPISPSLKLTFTYTVCFYCAYILGAIPAFVAGFAGDAFGYLIAPNGAYFLFGLTLGLYAFFTGVLMNYIPAKSKRALYAKTVVTFLAGYALFTLLLNSAVNYYYCILFIWDGIPKKAFLVYLAGRLSVQTVVYAVNAAVSIALLPVVSRAVMCPKKTV